MEPNAHLAAERFPAKILSSGVAIAYTAPGIMPATASVMIVATSVADPTKSNNATITLTAPVSLPTVSLPSELNFGTITVETSKTIPLTLTNSGSGDLSISSIQIDQVIMAFTETNNCGTKVPAGGSCIITTTFTATKTSLIGGHLLVTDNAMGSPQEVLLSGKGKKDMTSASVRSALTKFPVVTAPAFSGPNRVGSSVADMTDVSRNDPYVPDGGARELAVRFWYPAVATVNCAKSDYTPTKVWSRFEELVGVHLPLVTTNSCADAPVMDGTHPVVVFTPGYTGTNTDYTFLFEDLASRGYVVASVGHTYEATAVEFPDGRMVNSVLGSHLGGPFRGDAEAMAFAVSVRLRDLEFVLDELAKMNVNSESPLAGKLDLSRIAVAGHSMGAFTALLALEQDARFKAGVLIDGGFTLAPAEVITTPVAVFAMGREWSSEGCGVWNALQGPRLALNFLGADHMTPTDGIWIAKGAIAQGDMGLDKTVTAVRSFVAAFLDANLQHKRWDALLSGPSIDFPSVEVVTQNQPICSESPYRK
jgi:dienelactone hydrolase